MKTVAEYHDILIHLRSDIFQQYQEFMRNPNDIETIHALRVSIRKLRSMISFIKPLFKKEDYQTIQAQLRQIHQTSSDLRNLDVLIQEWIAFQEQNKLIKNYTKLTKLFQEQREYLKKELKDDNFQFAFNQVMTLINISLASIQIDNFQIFVDQRLNKWGRLLNKLSKSIDQLSRDSIHALRIKYKKLRYVQTLLEIEVLDLKTLKKNQDILGVIHDTYGAIELLDNYSNQYQETLLDAEINLFKGYHLLKRDALTKQLQIKS